MPVNDLDHICIVRLSLNRMENYILSHFQNLWFILPCSQSLHGHYKTDYCTFVFNYLENEFSVLSFNGFAFYNSMIPLIYNSIDVYLSMLDLFHYFGMSSHLLYCHILSFFRCVPIIELSIIIDKTSISLTKFLDTLLKHKFFPMIYTLLHHLLFLQNYV